ncbi:MAG: hypothetical protein WD875_05890 [Pirellulales bacterium]
MSRLLIRSGYCRRFAPILATWLCALVGATVAIAPAFAQSDFRDEHESAATAWQAAASDTRYRVERHARVQDGARSGESCEMISLTAGVGSFVYFAYPTGQARVIDELRPTVWMKSDRQGLQILARIVLPRTLDPKTGSAATVLVRGASYTQIGQWQMLAVEGLPKALDAQVRILRARLGPNVDPREAYVDQVVVNLYGGRGRINVWLDDLDVAGFVGRRPDQQQADVAIAEPKKSDAESADVERRVEMKNDILLVAGKPFFPRMIEYRGERLGELAQIGFNAIWLRRPVSADFVGEARRAGLWVVCPPPQPMPETFGDEYDGVLAWNLGHHLSAAELDAVTQLAAALHKRDRAQQRPTIAQADSQLRGYSRVVDILLIDRPVLGTSLELADYARYIGDRPQLARPGTPFWAAIDLDLDPRLVHQIESLSHGGLRETSFDGAAVRQTAVVALGAGARGLLLNTHAAASLRERRAIAAENRTAADRDVISLRAMELALLNRELQLCEAWLTEGQRAATARGRDAQAAVSLIQNRRGKLLLATRILPGGQFAPGAHPIGALSLVAPGSPETDDAFALSAAGLRAIEHRRVAGGMSLNWDGFGTCGFAVMSSDSLLMTSLDRQAQEAIRPTAAYKIAVARRSLADAEAASRQIGSAAQTNQRTSTDASAASLAAARTSLRRAEQQFATGDATAAFRAADAAASAVTLWQRAAWERVVRGWPSPVASPLAVTPLTLVEQSQFADRVARAVVGRNSLAEGECENLPAMVEAGWKHWQHTLPSISTHVELSPATPFAGQSSLYLSATANDASLAETLIETPPVWVVSAPVQFAADTAVRIRGRVRIPKPISGSVDGLEIIDSLGGPALATRIGHAPQWQEFALYRYASRLDSIAVTFALTGLGEVWIDNVVVEPVALPAGGVISAGRARRPMQSNPRDGERPTVNTRQ